MPEEHVHHDEHQHHGLAQGLHHLDDGNLHEAGAVVGHGPVDSLGEEVGKFRHARLHRLRHVERIGAGRDTNRDGGDGLAVHSGVAVVTVAAEFHAGHVFHLHRGAVGKLPYHHVAEFFGRGKPAARDDDGVHLGARRTRRLVEFAGGELHVLRLQGLFHVGGRQAIGGELLRLEPDAHGIFGAEQDGLAHAGHAANRVEHVGRREAAEVNEVEVAVLGINGDEHKIVALRLRHRHPDPPHVFRESRLDALVTVLGFHRGDVDVGARIEGERQRARAQFGSRLHVEQMLDAVHLLLDQLDDRVFDHLRGSAGIGHVEGDLGRRHRRILGHRQILERDDAHEQNQDGDDPGEDGSMDEEAGHVSCPASAARVSRPRPAGPSARRSR